MFLATPNRRAIVLTPKRSERCNRRISAQFSTVITPCNYRVVKIHPAPGGQFSRGIDTRTAGDAAESLARNVGTVSRSEQSEARDVLDEEQRIRGRVIVASSVPNEIGSRTQRKRVARMAKIERTAARLFAEKGYDGANLDDIAAELDLRGSSLYHYFSSKEDLFLRCLRHSADQVFARLRELASAQERGQAPSAVMRSLLREQILIEVRDYPEFVPLFFQTYVPVPELYREVLALRREHAEIFERVSAVQQDEAGLDPADVRVWLGTAFGALAYLPEWYDPSGPMGVDDLADRMSSALISALPTGR